MANCEVASLELEMPIWVKKGDNSDNGNNKQWSYYDKQIIRKIKKSYYD